MKIALIQTKQNELYDFGNENFKITKERAKELQNEMIEQTLKLVEEAGKMGVDLIVTTEAINFTRMNKECDENVYDLFEKHDESKILKSISKIAEKSNAYIVASLYNWQEDNKLYNSAYIYGRDGKLIKVYNKIHLAGSEAENLSRGDKYVIFNTEFGNVGVCICWDMQFPEVSRELSILGAELIVCPTWGWEQIYAHARAYENGIFVASAMGVPYKGIIEGLRNPSEVISPNGNLMARACNNEKQILLCDIDLKQCKEYKTLRMNDRQTHTYVNIAK